MFPTIPDFPNYEEEWRFFCTKKKLSRAKKGRQVGADMLPVEFYVASGSSGQERLAELLYKAKLQGPPITWRGGPMWAAPHKPTIPLSPLNSRALLCADHKAKIFSSAIRECLAPVLVALAKGNQSGAMKGGGTEFPLFIARLFFTVCCNEKDFCCYCFSVTCRKRTTASFWN